MGSEGMVIVKWQPEGESANQFTKPIVRWQAAGRNSRRSSPFLSAESNYSDVLVACRTFCGVRSAAPAPSFFSPFCCGTAMGFTSTGTTPCFPMSSSRATLNVTSITRPATNGPRSATLTVADLPFSRLIKVPRSSSGWSWKRHFDEIADAYPDHRGKAASC
jgi:hypothetical protein